MPRKKAERISFCHVYLDQQGVNKKEVSTREGLFVKIALK